METALPHLLPLLLLLALPKFPQSGHHVGLSIRYLFQLTGCEFCK